MRLPLLRRHHAKRPRYLDRTLYVCSAPKCGYGFIHHRGQDWTGPLLPLAAPPVFDWSCARPLVYDDLDQWADCVPLLVAQQRLSTKTGWSR